MKKQITLIAILALSATSLFIVSCKKSSDSPAPTPVFTNDAAFLGGTYSVHDSSVTNHTATNYAATITTSTTTNDKFTISNFNNAGASCVVNCTYVPSGSGITITGGTVVSGGNTLGASSNSVTSLASPVKIWSDYYYSRPYYSYENIAVYTKQ